MRPTIARPQVLARLRADNPWWRESFDASQPPWSLPRRSFYDAFRALVLARAQRAVVLLGARRVGKTTLLLQLIGEMLRQRRFEAVLFASIDTPAYADLGLDDLLELFEEARPHDPRAPRLVVLDEIQYLRDWERHLKVLVDRHPRTRFVVSGSAGAALRRASTESGAGRFSDFFLPPLTFAEYLAFRDAPYVQVEPAEEDGRRWRFRCVEPQRLNDAFLEYVNFGGYPETLFQPQVRAEFAQFVARDIVDKVLLRDLPVLYGITDIPELNRLFAVLAFNTGCEVSLDGLAKGAGIAKPTIKRYLTYLQAAFLLYKLPRIDQNARRYRRERAFKVHLANSSMRAALFAPVGPDDEQFGQVVESAVLGQWLHLPGRIHAHYARWKEGGRGRDAERGGEVDLVVLDPGRQRPAWMVEVKWSDRVLQQPDKELRPLLQLHGRYPEAEALVTTRTRLGRAGGTGDSPSIRAVPAALYAYALGYLSARADGRFDLPRTGGLDADYLLKE